VQPLPSSLDQATGRMPDYLTPDHQIGDSPPPLPNKRAPSVSRLWRRKEGAQRRRQAGGSPHRSVKSSGSKQAARIGQNYISERTEWRARTPLHEQDRSTHVKSSARFGVGVVSISGAQIACLQRRCRSIWKRVPWQSGRVR
jgi:hypothetical protein